MTVSPAGLLTNNAFGIAPFEQVCTALTQIPPPPLQQVLTTHSWLLAQSSFTLQVGLLQEVVPGTQRPPPPLTAPQIQPEPQ